jgi:hypothetical protein
VQFVSFVVKKLLYLFVHFAQPIGHDAHHLKGEVRCVMDEGLEFVFVYGNYLALGF